MHVTVFTWDPFFLGCFTCITFYVSRNHIHRRNQTRYCTCQNYKQKLIKNDSSQVYFCWDNVCREIRNGKVSTNYGEIKFLPVDLVRIAVYNVTALLM